MELGPLIEQATAFATIVTVWVQVAPLPWLSVTVQSTLVAPTLNRLGASLTTVATAQLSAVTEVPRLRLLIVQEPASALVMILAGQLIVGASVSRIVTVCAQVLLLPLASVTVQCTVVLPTGNCTGASLVTQATLQLSPVSGEPSAPPVA